MLNDEVIEAVRAGRFHVWAVRHVDEGIELLSGSSAGRRDADGRFPAASFHYRVEQRMRHYAEQVRAFALQPDGLTADERASRRKPGADARRRFAAAKHAGEPTWPER
jgi:hypothetical protein